MENVTDQTPGREPDNVTPDGWTTTPAGFQVPADLDDDPRLWTGEPVAALDVRHFAGLADAYTMCGLERATVRWTDDAVTPVDCPRCTVVIVDEQLAEPEPERRTVSLEVLTDEVRAAAEAGQAGVGELFGGKVGIVMRLNGAIVDVPELDTLWAAPYRRPADVLAVLLRQARMYADGLHGNTGAELLMPTPDVLAALAGTPDARLLTVPVHVLAMDIQTWMLLYATDDDGDGAESLELVTAAGDCTDADCVNGAVCAVLTVPGGAFEDPVVHFNAYSRLQVRIPADQAGPATAPGDDDEGPVAGCECEDCEDLLIDAMDEV